MNRILVVRLGALGDVLHALPAVSTLHASFPAAEITWVVDPKWAVLLDGNPAVSRIVTFDRRSWQSIAAARAALRRNGEFDAAIDFQGLIKSALLGRFLARCSVHWGFDRSQVREKPAAWFYDRTWIAASTHVVDRNVELAMAAGAKVRCMETPMPAGRAEGELPAGPFVLTSPMAGWVSKQWPAEYFAELARLIVPVPLVLNGAPGAEEQLRAIAGSSARIHLSGIEGLIDATRRAAAVVGVDSGPLHIAAALGKPGVAIFGPTDPARNGPYGGTFTVLRDSAAVTTYKRESTVSSCMRAIEPAQVAAALRTALESQ